MIESAKNQFAFFNTWREGSDHGSDTWDLAMKKTLNLANSLMHQSVAMQDDDAGVLTVAEFFAPVSKQLFAFCRFNFEDESSVKTKTKYVQTVFLIQKYAVETFADLGSWSFGDSQQIAQSCLQILRSWDLFLEEIYSPTQKQAAANYPIWRHNLLRNKTAISRNLSKNKTDFLHSFKHKKIDQIAFDLAVILDLGESGKLEISQIEYITLTIEFVRAVKEGVSNMDFWFQIFDEGIEIKELLSLETQKQLQADLIKDWFENLKSLQKSWTEFGKQHFKTTEVEAKQCENENETEKVKNESKFYKPLSVKPYLWKQTTADTPVKMGKISLTGQFGLERDKVISLIEANNWEFSDKVSDHTDILVVGYRPGQKLAQSLELKIKISSFADFLRILSLNQPALNITPL